MAGPFLASASATVHHLLTRTHTRAHSTHTLLRLHPLSPAIPRHTHSPLRCCAAIGCALALVALSGHTQRELPAEGVACLCVCVHTVTCAEVSLLCALFPRMRSHGNPCVPLLSVAFGAFQDWMSLLSSGRRGSISSSQTAVLACFDRNNEAELLRKTAGVKWGGSMMWRQSDSQKIDGQENL